LLEQAREFWGTSHRSRGKTGLTTQENECQEGKLRLRENRRSLSISKNPENVVFGSMSRLPSCLNSGAPTPELAMADGSWRVPHDDSPMRGELGWLP
ncbi:MAG: hypothetical protein ABSH35_28125, partial [Isosphaeraceae bacterium]